MLSFCSGTVIRTDVSESIQCAAEYFENRISAPVAIGLFPGRSRAGQTVCPTMSEETYCALVTADPVRAQSPRAEIRFSNIPPRIGWIQNISLITCPLQKIHRQRFERDGFAMKIFNAQKRDR